MVLRQLARHGFFSALLLLVKALLVAFVYAEGAQPLTSVPSHKHNTNLSKPRRVDVHVYSEATGEDKSTWVICGSIHRTLLCPNPNQHRINSNFILGPELTHNLHPPRVVGDTSCGRSGGICRTTPNGPHRSYTPSTRRRSCHSPEGEGTGSECWLSRRGRKEPAKTLTRSSSFGSHRRQSQLRKWILRVLF